MRHEACALGSIGKRLVLHEAQSLSGFVYGAHKNCGGTWCSIRLSRESAWPFFIKLTCGAPGHEGHLSTTLRFSRRKGNNIFSKITRNSPLTTKVMPPEPGLSSFQVDNEQHDRLWPSPKDRAMAVAMTGYGRHHPLCLGFRVKC